MSNVDRTQELYEMLGENRYQQIFSLFSFKEMLDKKLNEYKYDDNMLQDITQKFQSLTDLVVRMLKISNARHISADAKNQAIVNIIEDLDKEISSTEKVLQGKIKAIAADVKDTVKDKADNTDRAMQDNIDLMKAELKEAKKEESELKRQTNSKKDEVDIFMENTVPETVENKEEKKTKISKDESIKRKKKKLKKLNKEYEEIDDNIRNAMTVYKDAGFFRTFKRLWNDRKNNPEKKQGFLEILRDSLYTAQGNKEMRTSIKEEIDELYKKQCLLDKRIKNLEQSIKQLSKEKGEARREITNAGIACLEGLKNIYSKAVSPISYLEITSEKVEQVVDKIPASSDNKEFSDWKEKIHRNISLVFIPFSAEKLDKIEGNIESAKQDISRLEKEKVKAENLRAKREDEFLEIGAILSGDSYSEHSVGNKIIRGISKLQIKAADSRFKRKEKAIQKKYDYVKRQKRALTRYEGIDR